MNNFLLSLILYIINQSRLDLLFIMDITNSMDNYLDQAKNGILDMIKKIQEQCPGIEITRWDIVIIKSIILLFF